MPQDISNTRDPYVVLVELPRNPEIMEAYGYALASGVGVDLFVKGYFPLYDGVHTPSNITLGGCSLKAPVPTICVLAGVDPRDIQTLYSGLDDERYAIITSALPFKSIRWYRNEPNGECTLIERVVKSELSPEGLKQYILQAKENISKREAERREVSRRTEKRQEEAEQKARDRKRSLLERILGI